MEIESQLTKQKYMRLLWSMRVRSPYFQFTVGLLILVIILELVTDLDLFIVFILLLVVVIVYLISIPYAAFSRGNRNFFLPIKYIFNDDEITIISPISRETVKWDAFVKWKDIGGYYLIYASSHNFFAVSKSAISALDVSTFESLLHSKIKSS